MSSPRRRLQHTLPVVISSLGDDAVASVLQRIRLSPGSADGPTFSEAWLQRLINKHPALLPVNDIESAIETLIPLGMEVPTAHGFVDNLYVTPDGVPVVVECKLWRNPEARRKVMEQILDYAHAMTSWSYSELDAAVRKALGADWKPRGQSVFDIVCAQGAVDADDESEFIDALQRNLRSGRMLLLVVGDGIREGTESLAEFLQQHGGFRFSIALVEMAVFQLEKGQFLLQPRILARTLNIERGVVRILDGQSVTLEQATLLSSAASNPQATSLSEEEYFRTLEAAHSETASALKEFVAKASDEGIFLAVAKQSASLKWESPQGRNYTLGSISIKGELITYSVPWGPTQMGKVEIAHEYLRDLGILVNATLRQTPTPEQWHLRIGKDYPPALTALKQSDQWLEKIRLYKRRLLEAEANT